MCMEDEAIARGKFPTRAVEMGASSLETKILSGDPKRVAIIVSFDGGSVTDPVTGVLQHDKLNLFFGNAGDVTASITLTDQNTPLTLDIYHYGQLITGQMSYNMLDASGIGANGRLVTILSDINPPPIAQYPNKGKA